MDTTNGGRDRPEVRRAGGRGGPEVAAGRRRLRARARRKPAAVPALRASDRERDAVVQQVQQAFAEGRLDDTEFDERMRAALTARTHGELDVLLADLPAEDGGAGTGARRGRAGAGAVRGRAEELGPAGRALAGARAVHGGRL